MTYFWQAGQGILHKRVHCEPRALRNQRAQKVACSNGISDLTVRGWQHDASISTSVEVCGRLVAPPVFKTGEAEHLGLAGSIPVRLRQPPPFQASERIYDLRPMTSKSHRTLAQPAIAIIHPCHRT